MRISYISFLQWSYINGDIVQRVGCQIEEAQFSSVGPRRVEPLGAVDSWSTNGRVRRQILKLSSVSGWRNFPFDQQSCAVGILVIDKDAGHLVDAFIGCAIQFISAVVAIRHVVAVEAQRQTHGAVAAEGSSRTFHSQISSWHDETTALFIRIVGAILMTIAQRREGDASARMKTAEFGAFGSSFTCFGSMTIFFVFPAGTIRFLVTNPRFPNAIAIIALKVILAASVAVWSGCRGDGRVSRIRPRASQFIRSITAIVLAIAFPPKRNAITIATFKHGGAAVALREQRNKRPRRTNSGCGGTIDFVRTVMTVIFSVTHPRFHDASLVSALELPWLAGIVTAIVLVRAINTVAFSITFPGSWKTVVIRFARKFSRSASGGRGIASGDRRRGAIIFIGTVATIVFEITSPAGRNAAAVVATKLIR